MYKEKQWVRKLHTLQHGLVDLFDPLKVYSIIALNAHYRFVFQGTSFFNKDKPPGHFLQIKMRHMVTKNPNNSAKTNLIGKVNNLSLIGQSILK
jgi:hypothetical protein